MASLADRLTGGLARARVSYFVLKNNWAVIEWQGQMLEAQLAVIHNLEQQVVDLVRCNLTLSQGLMAEIEEPGTVDGDLVNEAVQDWADELARLEEHIVA